MQKEELLRAISHITQCLSVNKTEIAYMLGVSRQAMYSWFDGTNMTKVGNKQIDDLVVAANMFCEFDGKLPRRAFRLPIFGESGNESAIWAIRCGADPKFCAHRLLEVFSSTDLQMSVIGSVISGRKRNMPKPIDIYVDTVTA